MRFGDHFENRVAAAAHDTDRHRLVGLVRRRAAASATADGPAGAQARQQDRAERQQQRLAGHRHHGQRTQRDDRAHRHADQVVREVVLETCAKR